MGYVHSINLLYAQINWNHYLRMFCPALEMKSPVAKCDMNGIAALWAVHTLMSQSMERENLEGN